VAADADPQFAPRYPRNDGTPGGITFSDADIAAFAALFAATMQNGWQVVDSALSTFDFQTAAQNPAGAVLRRVAAADGARHLVVKVQPVQTRGADALKPPDDPRTMREGRWRGSIKVYWCRPVCSDRN
jgi:hypothetical protein